nr:O-antigen ligase family protein [uncultured Albidiferax sp.]
MKKLSNFFAAILPFTMVLDYRVFKGISGAPTFLLMELFSFSFAIYYIGRVSKSGATLFHGKKEKNIILIFFAYIFFAVIFSTVNFLLHKDIYLAVRVKELFAASTAFFFIVLFLKNDEEFYNFFNKLIYSLVVVVTISFFQLNFGWPYFGEIGDTALEKLDFDGLVVDGNQATGFFNHPNGLALLILPFVPLTLTVALSKYWSGKVRFVFFIIFLACVSLIYSTKSKGVLIWVFVSIFQVYYIIYLKRYFLTRRYFISILLLSFLILYISFYLSTNNLVEGLGTISGRIQQWMAAIQLIFDNLQILIFGGGTFYMAKYSSEFSGGGYVYQNSHNYYLNQLLLYGVLGLFLFLLFLILISKKLIFTKNSKLSMIGIGCAIGAFTLLGASFFEPLIEGASLQAVLFGFLGMAVVSARLNSKNN